MARWASAYHSSRSPKLTRHRRLCTSDGPQHFHGRRHHPVHIAIGHLEVERQADQAFREPLGLRQRAAVVQLATHRRCVQRREVEAAGDPFFPHLADEMVALGAAPEHEGEDVAVRRAVLAAAHDISARALDGSLQFLRVEVPDPLAARLDPRQLLELRAEPRGVQLAERVARADVDPGVPADEAELETAAVGPFLADLIGAVDQRRIAEYEGASLAAADILGLVEADRPASAEGTERGSAKRGSD